MAPCRRWLIRPSYACLPVICCSLWRPIGQPEQPIRNAMHDGVNAQWRMDVGPVPHVRLLAFANARPIVSGQLHARMIIHAGFNHYWRRLRNWRGGGASSGGAGPEPDAAWTG